MNFGEHALGRKLVMLDHVRVRREVERMVRERQRLAPKIALAIIHAAIRDGFAKRFCVHSVIHGRGAPAELGRVNRQRAELRANVEEPRRLMFGCVRQDVPQDANFSPAVAQGIANPFREIRGNPRVAGDRLENLLEAFERGALASALHFDRRWHRGVPRGWHSTLSVSGARSAFVRRRRGLDRYARFKSNGMCDLGVWLTDRTLPPALDTPDLLPALLRSEVHFRPRLVLAVSTVDPVSQVLVVSCQLGGHPAELEIDHD